MKISILGSDGTVLCQIPALRKAFESLGYELTPYYWESDVSFIFVGNPWFDQVIKDKQDGKVSAKLIFNILDIPLHISDYPIERLREQLSHADAVATISQWTHDIVKEKTGQDSTVIYYPAKSVWFTDQKKYHFKAALVGRINDPNKYAGMAISALIGAGYEEKEVAIVGGEYPNWGTYCGIVTDEVLNDIYNSVDYVIMLDRYAGIGLPAYEGAVCGAIPIIHSHLTTRQEFWDDSPLGETYKKINDVTDIKGVLMSLDDHYERKQELKKQFREYVDFRLQWKFDPIMVVKRILKVYERIS